MKMMLVAMAVALAILAGGYGIASAVDPPHNDYRLLGNPGYKPLAACDGTACHSFTNNRFLPGYLDGNASNDFTNFCLSCHSAAGEAHEKSAGTPSRNVYNNHTGLLPGNGGSSHSWNGDIGNAGTRVPTISGFSGTAYMPGGKVRCQTCHFGMDKAAEENINWASATDSGDHTNFVISSGSSTTKQYLSQYLKVYRYPTALTRPTESRTKKNYLVNYSAYTYNDQNKTITFKQAQGTPVYVYADITQPYYRVGNSSNQICADCHNDRLDRNVSHAPGTGVKDGHPVMVPFTNRSGLHPTLKGSADSNIFTEGGKVECTSCHDPHNSAGSNAMILRNADSSALCTNCHKVNGYSGYSTASISMHNGSKHSSSTICLDCHATHGSNNILLIRSKINGKTINFQNFSGTNNFVNAGGTGLCQVCHTATSHYKADGTGQDHNVGRNCTQCHTHGSGFSPFGSGGAGGCNVCHGFPPAPGDAGPFGWNDATGNLHSSHMSHLLVKYGLSGTSACATCHGSSIPRADHNSGKSNAGIDTSTWGGGTFSDGGTTGKVNTADDSCTNVSCHSTGGTRSWGGTGGCDSCHEYPGSATNDWNLTAGSNGHTIRADSDQMINGRGTKNFLRHLNVATAYNATLDTYSAVTADQNKCGKCHPHVAGNPTANHMDGFIELAPTGYGPGGTNFNIAVTHTGDAVQCTNVACHFNKTTPNWW